MKVKLSKWDIQDYLKTPQDRAFYLEAAIDEAQKDGDMEFLAKAFADVAKAVGNEIISNFFSGVSTVLVASKQIGAPASRKRSKRVLATA